MSIFFIAEIGINHNGDIKLAKELIDVAVESNANAVKFQKRDINLVYKKDYLDQLRESPFGTTQRDQKIGLEFDENQYDEINQYCKYKDIEWFASAWDINSLSFLDKYNLNYHKIASAMIVDKNLLNQVAQRGQHTFISTGMSILQDIDEAVNIFEKKNCSYELMHCISTYPMKPEHANLLTIQALKERYNCKVGYSGHETGLAVSFAAFSQNITSLERHITLNRAIYGSDQAASLEPKAFKELISIIKKMELALGKNIIGEILEDEIPIANKLREHIS